MATALLLALLAGLAASFAISLTRSSSGALSRSPAQPPPAAGGLKAKPSPYVPRELVVGYRPGTRIVTEIRRATGIRVSPTSASSGTPNERILRLPHGVSVTSAAGRVGGLSGVTYAVPNYIAHAAGEFIPDDRGRSKQARGWEKLQWNFISSAGIEAPEAWETLIRDHRAGASGVVVAVLDTGVAYRNWHNFKRSPDFAGTKFVDPCDLVLGTVRDGRCTNPYPLDRQGHGTFVAGTIAEATNNRIGVTGLAYNASIMPVRVLNAQGDGNAGAIALGIRYAAAHGAKVINLSIEFSPGTTASEIPDIVSAVDYAYSRGTVVVAAAGNDSVNAIAYPARESNVISVGATTRDLCLAYYSNTGKGLDIVAPGGGDDSSSLHTPNCHPDRNLPSIYQMTFNNPRHWNDFSLPGGWWGTSMSTPEVAAGAAMVIASGVLGRDPTPAQIADQLEYSARPLGTGVPNGDYGYGLLDLAAAVSKVATAPAGTGTTTTTTPTTTGAVTPAASQPQARTA